MSFKFGQFRRDQIPVNNYLSSVEYVKQNYQRSTGTALQKRYVDSMLVIPNRLEANKTYYLQVEINKFSSSQQNFALMLKKSTNSNVSQTIDTFSVNQGEGTETFEFIITPNMDYNQIIFFLIRTSTDQTLNNGDGTYGRKTIVTVLNFGQVTDLIENFINHNPLIKIGVQGSVGMLMVINGEPIRIGPSGIYEINNGYKIKSFGIVVKDNILSTDGKQYFILDYQY